MILKSFHGLTSIATSLGANYGKYVLISVKASDVKNIRVTVMCDRGVFNFDEIEVFCISYAS